MHTQTSVRRHCLHYILFSCASGWRTAHVWNSFSLNRFVWIPVVLVPHPWNICLGLLWCKRTNCKKMAVLLTWLPQTLTLSIVAKNIRQPVESESLIVTTNTSCSFLVRKYLQSVIWFIYFVPHCSYYMHLPLMSCSTWFVQI